MDSKLFLRGFLALTTLVLGTCGWGDCPEPVKKDWPLKSGAYPGIVKTVSGWMLLKLPARAVIDRQAETATFTYERDGKQVVERWKITLRPTQ